MGYLQLVFYKQVTFLFGRRKSCFLYAFKNDSIIFYPIFLKPGNGITLKAVIPARHRRIYFSRNPVNLFYHFQLGVWVISIIGIMLRIAKNLWVMQLSKNMIPTPIIPDYERYLFPPGRPRIILGLARETTPVNTIKSPSFLSV